MEYGPRSELVVRSQAFCRRQTAAMQRIAAFGAAKRKCAGTRRRPCRRSTPVRPIYLLIYNVLTTQKEAPSKRMAFLFGIRLPQRRLPTAKLRSTTRPDAARPAEQRASQRPIPAQNGGAEKPISPAAPFPNREAGASPHSTTRPDAARSAEQRASQRPLPAQNGSAEKPTPQTVTHAPSGVLSDRQRRKPAAPVSTGSMTAPTPVSQESRGPQRSPAAEASAKRPAPQERKAGTQSEPQKKEQTLYHRPGTAGIAPTAVGINTEAASAAQKPAAEKAAKKPFVPLTGRTPESIPSHLDLHEASQKTTRRPQEKQEVTNDE